MGEYVCLAHRRWRRSVLDWGSSKLCLGAPGRFGYYVDSYAVWLNGAQTTLVTTKPQSTSSSFSPGRAHSVLGSRAESTHRNISPEHCHDNNSSLELPTPGSKLCFKCSGSPSPPPTFLSCVSNLLQQHICMRENPTSNREQHYD